MGLRSWWRAATAAETQTLSLPVQALPAHNAYLTGRAYSPAGPPVDSTGAEDSHGQRNMPQGWQVRAWELWKCVGELHAPTSYVARAVSRMVDWKVDDIDGMGDDPDKTFARLDAALGTTSLDEFTRLLALNFQVAGDVWVIRTRTGWDVLSVIDRSLAKRVQRAKEQGLYVRRFWDPDPTELEWADAGTRGIINAAEELRVLSMLSRAQGFSRIAQAGILMVPAEQQFEGGDPFGVDLEQTMTTAIRDVASPAAFAPIKVEMSSELIEKVRHLTFDRPFDEQIPGKIEQAIRRIALGLDIPPELLLGMATSTSHWGAWLAQEEAWKGTVGPLAERIGGILGNILAVTETPMITGMPDLGTQADPVPIIPDPTRLLAHRSSVRDAVDGARLGAVGLDYVRRALGAGDTDVPTSEDLEIIRSMPGSRTSERAVTTDETRTAPSGGDPVDPVERG